MRQARCDFGMIPIMRSFLIALFGVTLSLCATLGAAEPTTKAVAHPYTRYETDRATGAAKLEVAIASFKNAAGQQVDLVSAIHIGDAKYYQELNRRFKVYDAVLYE